MSRRLNAKLWALFFCIASGALLMPALAEEQRLSALDIAQSIAEAETLADGCGLQLNMPLDGELRADALRKRDGSSFATMQRFARTYTLDLIKNQNFCRRALALFGPDGEKVKGVLLSP
jgi:hypothetical protein